MTEVRNDPPTYVSNHFDPDEPPPPPPPIYRTVSISAAGWLSLGAGILAMFIPVLAPFLYPPLFFVAFLVSVAIMTQGRTQTGMILLISTLVVPPFVPTRILPLQIASAIRMLSPRKSQAQETVVASASASASALALAPVPTPIEKVRDQAAIDKICAEPLSQAHSWQIQIVYSDVLESGVGQIISCTFSPDGERIIYPLEEDSGYQLRMRNLRDHSLVDSVHLAGIPAYYDWSPDGKSVAYVAGNQLHIVDLKSRRDVLLPPVISIGYPNDLAWIGPSSVATLGGVLDLETLKTTGFPSGQAFASLKAQYAAQFGSASDRTAYAILLENGSRTAGLSGFFVGESDGSYKHPLVSQGSIVQRGIPSPDQRHIIVNSHGELIDNYLGLQDPLQTTFRIGLNSHALLSEGDQKRVEDLRQKGISFSGQVYSPLINPLNDRLVGAVPNTLKGFVKITEWHDSDLTVAISTDLTLNHSIHAGDIVTNIAGGQPNSNTGNFSFGDVWMPLQSTSSGSGMSQNAAPSAK